jgi:hypothetical protein
MWCPWPSSRMGTTLRSTASPSKITATSLPAGGGQTTGVSPEESRGELRQQGRCGTQCGAGVRLGWRQGVGEWMCAPICGTLPDWPPGIGRGHLVAQAARDPIERCVIAERHRSGEMLGRRCNLDNRHGNSAYFLPNADSLYTDWNDSLAGGVLWPSAPRLGGNVDVEWAAWRGWVNFTLSTAVRDGTAPQRPRWAWARGS